MDIPIDLTTAIIAGAIAGAVILAIAAFFVIRAMVRSRHDRQMREQFGPEYARTIDRVGDREKAQRVLDERVKRVESFELRTIGDEEREQFTQRWRMVQADFVDHPAEALNRADGLLVELMRRRGFADAAEGPERRAEDLSVTYAGEAEEYRQVRRMAAKGQAGEASTEDLRAAMRRLRGVYETLMGRSDGHVSNDNRKVPVEAR